MVLGLLSHGEISSWIVFLWWKNLLKWMIYIEVALFQETLIMEVKKELNYVKLKFYVYLEDLARSEEKHLKLGFIATGPTVFRLSV